MATTAQIVKNNRIKALVAKHSAARKVLKKVIIDPKASDEDKAAAELKLQKMSRNASKTRIRNRCEVTGRARGYYRKFGLSRIALRHLGHRGEVPGLTKSSW